MSFTLLPPETIVSRYLKEIILGDPYLQYVLELNKSGYIVPRFIRQDLDYGEMIQAIRDHWSRWQRVKLGEPKSIEVPDALRAMYHGNYFSDGVYALCFETLTISGIRTSLSFYQFPSFNKGTNYKYWVHDNLGFYVSAFAIQSEIDLLVLLEYCPFNGPDPGRHPHQRYRIHLRTMTTNESHPLAMTPSPLLDVGKVPQLSLEDRNPIGLYGRILFLRFTPDPYHPAFGPVIILFDWIAGEEVGRIKPGSYAGCSITFLSEEYLVIPQGCKHDTTTPTDRSQTGSLLIYYLPPYTEGLDGRQANHIATLAFPRLCEHQSELRLRLCGGAPPLPDSTYWSQQTKPVPKIYDLNRWNHICLHYEAFSNGNAPLATAEPRWTFGKHLSTSGLLHMSSRALLNLLNEYVNIGQLSESVLVPWATWGPYAACLPVPDIPSASMWGRKSAFVNYGAGVLSNHESRAQLFILDFIPDRRLMQQPTADERLVDMIRFTTLDDRLRKGSPKRLTPSQQLVVGTFIEPKVATLGMRYRRTIVNLESEKHQNLCAHGLEIDDEHFVTALESPRDFTGRQFFYVYTL